MFTRYTKLMRRNYTITLPTKIYESLREEQIYIGLITHKGLPTSVQLSSRDRHYLGTLKDALGVVSFRNGNICDFRERNVILKGE